MCKRYPKLARNPPSVGFFFFSKLPKFRFCPRLITPGP